MPRFTISIVETVERVAHLVVDTVDEDAAVGIAKEMSPNLDYGQGGHGHASYHIHDVGMSMSQDPEDTHVSTRFDMDPGLWEDVLEEED